MNGLWYTVFMNKNVIIGTARNGKVRLYLADTRDLCEEARRVHDMYPTSLAALGRVLSVTGIMALMQKEEQEAVTVTINGGGPIGTVMAVGLPNGDLKGFVGDPHIYLKYNDSNKLAVGMAVGRDGYLKVTKDLKLKQNYTSQVSLQTGEIGDDFAYYFSVSEQVPTVVSVGVLVDTDSTCKSAGVMILELLPGHGEEDIVALEELTKRLRPISSVLAENNDLLAYAKSLFEDFVLLDEKELRYHCDCSKDRFLRNLLTLSKTDLEELLDEEGIDIRCEFCDKTYHFGKDDLELLRKYVVYK